MEFQGKIYWTQMKIVTQNFNFFINNSEASNL